MGMYDTIIFTCPNCSEDIEMQTKVGECILREISSDHVPLEMARRILMDPPIIYCDSCGKSFFVVKKSLPPPAEVSLTLKQP